MNIKISRIVLVGIAVMLIFITGIQSIPAQETTDTELQISEIRGGVAQVSMDIKNIGSEIAENITSSISVTGGLLNNINVYHECSGCSSCGTTLDPGAIKTESTIEAGIIFGVGPITIDVTAGASNADTITTSASGFVIGIFILIQ
jgi:hypothetical protein